MSRSRDSKGAAQQGAGPTDTCFVVSPTGGDGGSPLRNTRSLGIGGWNQGRDCSLTGSRSWAGANGTVNGAPSEI